MKNGGWKKFFVEVGSIVFAVLLALFVNELRQNAAVQESVQRAQRNLRNEIQTNRKQVESRIPYHKEMVKTLSEMKAQPVLDTKQVPGWRGLLPPLYRKAAYETAMATEALANMDFDTVEILAFTYSAQDMIAQMNREVIRSLVVGELKSTEEIRGVFSEMGTLEMEMQRAYDGVLTHLDSVLAQE